MAWLDGNHWHRECNGSGDSGKLACLVYVHGVLAGAAGQSTLSSTKPVLCMPENGNNQQYMDVYHSICKTIRRIAIWTLQLLCL
jgi:hypothetical protein